MIRPCLTCGVPVKRPPSLMGARVYCSRACQRLPPEVALARKRASKREYARRRRAELRAQRTTALAVKRSASPGRCIAYGPPRPREVAP